MVLGMLWKLGLGTLADQVVHDVKVAITENGDKMPGRVSQLEEYQEAFGQGWCLADGFKIPQQRFIPIM